MSKHWEKVQEFTRAAIESHQLLQAGAKVLVATSGGPDSVLLARCLHHLGYQVHLAHVNYALRAEASEAEEQLVRQYAHEWEVPVYVHRCQPGELSQTDDSLQAAARKVRYQFFAEIMADKKIMTCATGHQADDQVETILLSLLRGNSPSIFSPIPIKRGPFIRPFLHIPREHILQAIKELRMQYGKDASNEKNIYLRNHIRNQLRPELQAINPSADAQLLRRNDWYQLQYQFVQHLLTPYLHSTGAVGFQKARSQPLAVPPVMRTS
ncbi:MAG: tRNA lysidine(34) synthetase TilS, partial [Bacteroidota bacterium]